jgi:hypothetical protein
MIVVETAMAFDGGPNTFASVAPCATATQHLGFQRLYNDDRTPGPLPHSGRSDPSAGQNSTPCILDAHRQVTFGRILAASRDHTIDSVVQVSAEIRLQSRLD